MPAVGPLLQVPGCLEGSACLSKAVLQPAGGAGGEEGNAWRPLAGLLPLGLEASLAPSPRRELGQPSCLPQPLPDSPLSAPSQPELLTAQPPPPTLCCARILSLAGGNPPFLPPFP